MLTTQTSAVALDLLENSISGKAEGGSEAINFNNAPKAALREFPRSGFDGRD
jgi:hypothetical protein